MTVKLAPPGDPFDCLYTGDIVRVGFYGAQTTICHRAKLIGIPRATGDSWIFRPFIDDTDKLGGVIFVSEGCTIAFLERPES